MKDLVTVIIPAYNCEKYVSECIQSIVNQTHRNLQIVIIDDGSTDRTGEICDGWAHVDERICVYHKNNEGVSQARNDGIECAEGEYIFFCDSDDTVDKYAIELLLQAMLVNQAELAMCTYSCHSEKVGRLADNDEHCEKMDKDELLKSVLTDKEYAGYLWNKLFIRDVLGENRFDKKLAYCEDLFFVLEYIQRINYGVKLQSPLYYYRETPNSVSSQKLSPRKLTYVYSQERIVDYLICNKVDDYLIRLEYYRLMDLYCSYIRQLCFGKYQERGNWIKYILDGFRKRKAMYSINPAWPFLKKMQFYIIGIVSRIL